MSNSRMISYAKHEEEFHGVIKLVSGEEILGKAVLTDDHGESLCFIQNPVAVQMIERDLEGNRLGRGIGFSRWMQLSDEDFYVIREKDILTISACLKSVYSCMNPISRARPQIQGMKKWNRNPVNIWDI